MANKQIINGNAGYLHSRTRYKAPLTGLYLDARKNAGYVQRSNTANGEPADNAVFDVPKLGGQDLNLVAEAVELDIPRDWGGVRFDIPGAMPQGLKIRDWFGGDATGDNPTVSLHYVGTYPGLVDTAFGGIGVGSPDDLYGHRWVYRYGKKFAEAPGWVAGAAKYTDILGRNWLLVSSYEYGSVSFGTKTKSKFILYYIPWRYVGDNPGETATHGWIEGGDTENNKWRRIELEEPSGIYLDPLPHEKELNSWPFNASGTRCASVICYEDTYQSDTILISPLDQVTEVWRNVFDVVEVWHTNLGLPGITPTLEWRSLVEDVPNIAGSVIQDFHELGEKDSTVEVYNDPLNGNTSQNITTHTDWMMDRRSVYRYGYPVSVDYVGDVIRVATVEPEVHPMSDLNLGWGASVVVSSVIDRDLELTGDIKSPTWDESEEEWVCSTGYTYYPGPGGSKGKCAKVIGRAFTQTYREGHDSDSSEQIGQDALEKSFFVLKMYERTSPEDSFAPLGVMAKLNNYGWTKPWQLTINHHYSASEEAFVTERSLSPDVVVVPDCGFYLNRRRALVDVRYGLVAVCDLEVDEEVTLRLYVDSDDVLKLEENSLGAGTSPPWIGGEIWVMGEVVIDDTPPQGGWTYATVTETHQLTTTPSDTFVNNSHIDTFEFGYPYTGELTELGFWGWTKDGERSLTDWGIRHVGNGKELFMVSYRWEDVNGSGSQMEPMGRARLWINPDMPLFRAKNPDPETQALEPYASRQDPRDVMGVYNEGTDVEWDEPFICNMYLFL